MKFAVWTLGFAVAVSSTYAEAAPSTSVKPLLRVRGERYTESRDDLLKALDKPLHIPSSAAGKEYALFKILESRQKAPGVFENFRKMIEDDRDRRSSWTEFRVLKETYYRPPPPLARSFLDYLGHKRDRKRDLSHHQMALVEILWKLAKDDYERISAAIALSGYDLCNESFLPLLLEVLVATDNPAALEQIFILIYKWPGELKEHEHAVLQAITEVVVPSAVSDPDCRRTIQGALRNIRSDESRRLADIVEKMAKFEDAQSRKDPFELQSDAPAGELK